MPGQLQMKQLLRNMRRTEASDLHLKVGMPPIYRINGVLRVPEGLPPLRAEDTERLVKDIMPTDRMQQFIASGNLDFSTYQSLEGDTPAAQSDDQTMGEIRRQDRFRCNIFLAGGGMHAAIRRVKPDIPDFESLHLPPVYRTISDESHEGLILVVGVTGSGKSTTLACMLERINETRSENIITIEDPVEYHLHPQMSIISQREIGTDVENYAQALKYIVRQDPDVVFIGEMRDHDTVLAAVQAAETGHLVFGSLHTADTMQCFSRIVEFFPQHEHAFIRSALANSLRAVCAQRLLPANQDTAGAGTVPACEVLLANHSVRERIREAEDEDIPMIIDSSTSEGMRSMTHSLAELVEKEMVKMQTALDFAPNREALRSKLKGVQVRSSLITGIKKGG